MTEKKLLELLKEANDQYLDGLITKKELDDLIQRAQYNFVELNERRKTK